MTKDDWSELLEEWRRRWPIKTRLPASGIDEFKRSLQVPDDLATLYQASNGLRYEWFSLLPIEQEGDLKNTWDSIHRANDPAKSKFFPNDRTLFDRFLVIAEIGAGYCACIDRGDGSIWFQDDEGVHQTDLSLPEFIETTFREVSEL